MLRLSNATVGKVGPNVITPSYDRSSIRLGIVHLGVGAFHRAHQAVYIDDCLNNGETDWGIVGASLRRPDTRDQLAPQNCLYALGVRDGGNENLRVVGSICDLKVADQDRAQLLSLMSSPNTRIVTLTVTEKGYAVDLTAGDLDTSRPDILRDLRSPDTPRTTLGFITEALARRRDAGVAPFTVLSCDNLPNNGKMLRRALVQFADARNPALGKFVAAELECPSTMVDRIVPATTDRDREAISLSLGVRDAWPVVTEPFTQWVVEDRFPTGRPGWEKCGVEVVSDVRPYEDMKLRLLNGAHTALAAIGRLAGYETVSAAIADPAIATYVDAFWAESKQTVESRLDPDGYIRRLRSRFENTSLAHKTSQIATDASLKLPQRILSPLRELIEADAPCRALVFAVAAWMVSCSGFDEAGRSLDVDDPALADWKSRTDQTDVSVDDIIDSFLRFDAVFESAWRCRTEFRLALKRALAAIRADGVLAAASACAASPAKLSGGK